MVKLGFSIAIFVLAIDLSVVRANSSDQEFIEYLESFAKQSRELKIPEFDYSYKVNFAAIQDLAGLGRQQVFYDSVRNGMSEFARHALSADLQVLYDILNYELRFNIDRNALEIDFKKSGSIIPTDGLAKLPRSRDWYNLYAKRWASVQVDVAQIRALSQREVESIRWQIKQIQVQLGFAHDEDAFLEHLNDTRFVLTDLAEVKRSYSQKYARVNDRLSTLFGTQNIPALNIEEAPDADADTPPGYYTDLTFYFNFYGGLHNTRSMDWLFMHEGIPGHHWHTTQARFVQAANFRAMFWYPGHSEGWAAYVERYGKELGLYQDVYSELGRWEWDLVRSVRLAIDCGIHYYGWTRDEARDYWHRYIRNREDILDRELNRITEWPGQVLSYKIGSMHIEQMLQSSQRRLGTSFDIVKFHQKLTTNGTMPLLTLQRLVLDD